MKRTYLSSVISILFIFLFTYAATKKWAEFAQFKSQLGQSPFITNFTVPVAWALPPLEIIIVGMLLSGIFFPKIRLYGLYASLFLMSMFTSYIFMMLNYSFYIPCSCGGILSKMSWSQHLVFNSVFVVLAQLAIFFVEPKKPRLR